MRDRGMIVTWVTDGVTYHGRVSNLDNKDAQQLHAQGKLTGKVIVRMEVPAAQDSQYKYQGGIQKTLVKVEKITLIGYYD